MNNFTVNAPVVTFHAETYKNKHELILEFDKAIENVGWINFHIADIDPTSGLTLFSKKLIFHIIGLAAGNERSEMIVSLLRHLGFNVNDETALGIIMNPEIVLSLYMN